MAKTCRRSATGRGLENHERGKGSGSCLLHTWQHAIAEDVARAARGVRGVQNRLSVDFVQQIDDEEVSYEIQSAMHHICGLSGAGIKVAVSNRTVVLSGTAASLPTKEHAERIARNYGILNVHNDIAVVLNAIQ
jgi:osmotically-inducible protein OsmY